MFMGQLEVRGQQKHDLTNGRMKMAILIVEGFGAQTINSRTAVERMDSFENENGRKNGHKITTILCL